MRGSSVLAQKTPIAYSELHSAIGENVFAGVWNVRTTSETTSTQLQTCLKPCLQVNRSEWNGKHYQRLRPAKGAPGLGISGRDAVSLRGEQC